MFTVESCLDLHTDSLLSQTAVTSGSPFGNGIGPAAADNISRILVADPLNEDLQWSEASFRGFFTLTIDTEKVNATYWAMSNTSKKYLPDHYRYKSSRNIQALRT